MAAGSLWDLGQTPTGTGPASPPTTLQPVQPRLGPEPLEVLASSACMPSASSCFPWDASQLPCSSNVTAFEHAFALGSEVDVQGGRMLYIHPDDCVDSGACEPICPVTAIFYEDDVPAEWKNYTPDQRGVLQRRHLGDRVPPAAPHRSVRSTRTTPSWRTSRPESRPPPRRTRPPSSLDRVRSLRSRVRCWLPPEGDVSRLGSRTRRGLGCALRTAERRSGMEAGERLAGAPDVAAPGSNAKRIAFKVLAGLFAAASFGGLFGAAVVFAWFDTDDGGIHRVHDMGYGALYGPDGSHRRRSRTRRR